MKIKSIRISNLFSFGYRENLDEATGLLFDTRGGRGSLHLLLGPNGSGKSNFVEILTQLFKRAFFQSTALYEHLVDSVTDPQRVLTATPNAVAAQLQKNRYETADEGRVHVVLELSDNDLENVNFVIQHRVAINEILTKYSNAGIAVWTDVSFESVRYNREIPFVFTFHPPQQLTVAVATTPATRELEFIKYYLQNLDYFRNAIILHNRIRPASEPEWPLLKQTFALLGSYRNYNAFTGSVSLSNDRAGPQIELNTRFRGESTKTVDTSEPPVFELVKRKIGYRLLQLIDQRGRDFAMEAIRVEEPFKSLDKLTKEHLKLGLSLEKPNEVEPHVILNLVDWQNRPVETSQLSSGEKGILHLLFTLYGYDLQNGVIIVDEPELHLHPQMQREFARIINEVRESFDLQFILASHSPQFVNRNSVQDVYRFHLDDTRRTAVRHPHIPDDQEGLVKILEYANSVRVLFVKRVILVEGDTDDYFFRFYLDWLKDQATNDDDWRAHIDDFEIISIQGKPQRALWTDFLSSFGLEISFIGDWDNIKEADPGINLQAYEDAYRKAQADAGSALVKKGSTDAKRICEVINKVLNEPNSANLKELADTKEYVVARHIPYAELIETIRSTDSARWSELVTKIETAYESRIFILTHGELEDYLGVESKSLDAVVNFCQSQFEAWITDPAFQTHRTDLEGIVRRIFASPEITGDAPNAAATVAGAVQAEVQQ